MTDDAVVEVEDAIRRLMATEIGVPFESLSRDINLVDLGVSSIKVLRIVAKIEKQYGIELEDDIVFRAETLRDLATAVAARVASSSRKDR